LASWNVTFDVVIMCQGTVFTQNILGTPLVWTVVTMGVSHDMSHDKWRKPRKGKEHLI